LFNLFRRQGKHREQFDHYLSDHVFHRGGAWYLGVYLEPFKKALDTFKEIHESVVARADIFGRLRIKTSQRPMDKEGRTQTVRRTQIPEKTTLAGGKT
jgi:hypothetical protein